MKVLIKKNSIYLLTILILSVTSCDSNRVFDKYKSLPNASWHQNKKIKFSFTVTDTTLKYNLFINLRNNEAYEFSNLYIITEMKFPNDTKIIDTLQYEMADANGKFLGKGFTDIKENKFFYKENIVFPVTGKYTFQVRQSMRKNGNAEGIEHLKGITDIGFRIAKSK